MRNWHNFTERWSTETPSLVGTSRSLTIRQFPFTGHLRKKDRHRNPLRPGTAYGYGDGSLMDNIPNCWLGVDSATRYAELDPNVRPGDTFTSLAALGQVRRSYGGAVSMVKLASPHLMF